MTTEDCLHTPEVEQQLAKEERGRRIVARVKASKPFMEGVRASIQARLRGEKGVRLEELKRKEPGA